jgi:hypothetical protein
MEPDAARRYQFATELADALEGVAELESLQAELPSFGRATSFAVRHPFLALMILAMVPHLLGSIVNISYNALRIVSELTPHQQATFQHLVLGYNLLAYPAGLAAVCALVSPVLGSWRKLRQSQSVSTDEAAGCRRRVVAFPLWVVALSFLGWLPGGFLFPLGLHLFAEPVTMPTFGHFVISFTMSGLIALTYAYFGVEFVSLRVLYPEFLVGASNPRNTARRELRNVGGRLRSFQVLAGVIPLFGAVLMLAVGPDEFPDNYLTFRLLVTLLIALGMMGFGLAVFASLVLTQTLNVLAERRP